MVQYMSATFNKTGRQPARAPRAFRILAALGVLAVSCGQPDAVDETVHPAAVGFADGEMAWITANAAGTVSFATYDPGDRNEDVSFTASGLVPGKAFLVVTNADPGAAFTLSGTLANAVPEARTALDGAAAVDPASGYLRDIPAVSAFNADPWAQVSKAAPSARSVVPAAPLSSVVGVTADNFTYMMYDDASMSYYTAPEPLTAKVRASVSADGLTLDVWVADDLWNAGIVTQAMVDATATRFLSAGDDDDIHEWVTGIFGSEYSKTAATSFGFITDLDTIDILIADIGEPGETVSGIVGYFHALHNYLSTVSGAEDSNERIMFFVDGIFLARKDGLTWESTDYWPQAIWSTLAHELQHMIQFNEKVVERNAAATPTWLDELCSAAAEDFVAYKLRIDGPRAVVWNDGTSGTDTANPDGRLPLFVGAPSDSLTIWDQALLDYSTAYAFSSWLARNEGHSAFSSLTQSTTSGLAALEAAAGSTLPSLLRDWAVAAIASSAIDSFAPWSYNRGTWFPIGTTDPSTTAYPIGSIDLAKYRWGGNKFTDYTGIKFETTIPSTSIVPASNLYIELPVAADGTASGTLTLYRGMSMTVVVTY